MRCDEVTRELAAPTSGPDPAALARHLAACPRCSAWAEASERLDRLWDATRPVEPPAAFETVWGRVTQATDAEA
ncbi:MAG: hypothetical protein IRY99_14580, partial [Isosphaeraceae bacterium]|nr:hypothetical protein [Isosphaeraceae bacterium]